MIRIPPVLFPASSARAVQRNISRGDEGREPPILWMLCPLLDGTVLLGFLRFHVQGCHYGLQRPENSSCPLHRKDRVNGPVVCLSCFGVGRPCAGKILKFAFANRYGQPPP